jgi:hypothetical protein
MYKFVAAEAAAEVVLKNLTQLPKLEAQVEVAVPT